MEKKKILYADMSLLLVAIIWGSGFVVTKNALDYVTPYYLLFFRFTISTIILSIVFFKNIKNASKQDIKAGIIIGSCLFAAFATQTVGLQYTEAGKQAFITATNVVMVPFIYWIISKKRPDKFDLAAAFLCLIGIGVLSLNKDLSMGYGDLLTLLCAVLFAMHISSTGHFAKESDPYVITIIQFLTAAILSFIFALSFEGTNIKLESNTIFPILYLAIFSTMTAFLMQTVAQKYTSSTHAAIILSLEAVFGSTFSIIFLKEPLTIKFFIGCMAILISVITSETKWEFLRGKKIVE
ncbi:DMT family transporter [Tissierella pigra]|uniref:DMT family transporter n=1 Tax=Tissierella pigra TaxID=2607614 RepID=A0A6N7Y0R6_9FIRM|nr:DMT family transporter [Tissierella pigra]MSU02088.1 DMT family transporter [Tissierella pigra]